MVNTEVAVVGAGVSGLLVARELLAAGREVTMIERGGMKPHRDQLSSSEHELDIPTARHNHETAPGQPAYPWQYAYGVGGTSLHWTGVTPRLLPSDFELRSRYGVGRDWPIAYKDLEPFYGRAEQALGVAGGHRMPFPRSAPYPQKPHPYAPVDRLLRPLLEPYFPLPQARPTASVNGRAPCCASARCGLCPVDARYSALHTLGDARLMQDSGFKLIQRLIAARLRLRGGRVHEIDCVNAEGGRTTIRAKTVILAANGIENASILLRSDLGGPDVGRWLFDHEHRGIEVRVSTPPRHGRGNSLATGISYAYAEHDSRARRAAMIVYPFNPGLNVNENLIQAVLAGHDGPRTHRGLRRLFDHTLTLDTLSEDLPRRDRFVELSPKKDSFGLPLNRISYPTDSEYVEASYRVVTRDLMRRLEPLGPSRLVTHPSARGGHQLGTCYMAERGGVVDPNLRHHRIQNLYVAGGSAFPTYSPVHPTLTIAALALRLGDHLAGEAA